jgi:hypothetical protein
VQQVHFTRWDLRRKQDDPASPGNVFVNDVLDDQALLVGLGHHLLGDIPAISYLHASPFFFESVGQEGAL